MTTKKAKYEPFGDVLSVEVAYLQAAHAIDVAVQYAMERRDIEALQKLSLTWMELGARIIIEPPDDDDDDDDVEEEDRVVGFGRTDKLSG